jgi:hypothetical protein
MWQMNALARVISNAVGSETDAEVIQAFVMFCAIGLIASLLLASYGFDLNAGLF